MFVLAAVFMHEDLVNRSLCSEDEEENEDEHLFVPDSRTEPNVKGTAGFAWPIRRKSSICPHYGDYWIPSEPG